VFILNLQGVVKPWRFFGVAAVFILNLQGVVKPWRFFGGAAVFILNLQGVVKPWRFFGVCCVVYFKPPRCCETLEVFFGFAAVFWLFFMDFYIAHAFICN